MDKNIVVAALYVRNSDTSKMDTEVQKAQTEALLTYAKQKGYEVPVNLIFREAISAIKHPYWERPELLHLWDVAERGSFDLVLVTELFRVARSASEQFAVIEHLKRFGVRVESISESFEDTSEGRLLLSIQGFLGEVEANKIKIRTSRGKFHRAKQALPGQGNPCYGYKWGDTKNYSNGCYLLNTDTFTDKFGNEWTEVTVVKWTYTSCLKGMSLRQMAMELSRMGIPTREGKDAWGVTTIRRFLTDRRYTGRAVTKTEDGEVLLGENIIPRIIDEDSYERVQRQLAVNAEMSPRNNKHAKDYLLRGVVFCGECGRRMHVKTYPSADGSRLLQPTNYKCCRNDGLTDRLHAHSVSISCHLLDDLGWEYAVTYIHNPERIHEHIAVMQEQIPTVNHAEGLDQDIGKITKAIANLYKMAEIAEDPAPLQERLISLQIQKRELEKLYLGVSHTEEKLRDLQGALGRFEEWSATQRKFLSDTAYQVTLDDRIAAIRMLGIRATIYPATEEKRVKLEVMPPDIERFLRSSYRE